MTFTPRPLVFVWTKLLSTTWFLLWGLAFLGTLSAADSLGDLPNTPRAVPTFACIGLYWRPVEGAADQACAVYYRPSGRAEWSEAMPLWFDGNEHPETPERRREYRGSIVGLAPATTYEIKLVLPESGTEERLTARTWDEDLKIARIVELPAQLNETFVITEGGSEEAGYVLYTSPSTGRSVLDGHEVAEVNLRVDAPYVIVRGLELRRAKQHGIELGAVHDVVIEDCDISGWGEDIEDGWGRNFDSAVYHKTPDGEPRTLRRIVIQNNRLHHPRSHSNSWMEARSTNHGSRHPVGPQGISFINPYGELVIRHNDIFSDYEHMFNDSMGEYHNFSYAGFPGRDSDIYGNRISHCFDDGIEMEGANMNVRCWGNVIDWTFIGIGAATTSLGPSYVFRNVYLHSRRGAGTDADSYKGQAFLKLGADPRQADYAHGRAYVLHNTVLQPAPWGGHDSTSGAGRGLHLTSSEKHQTNLVSRNNVIWTRASPGTAVYDGQRSPTNDFNHDLFNGEVDAVDGSEAAGLRGIPQFGLAMDARRPWTQALTPGTLGHDQAVRLPNFNDAFSGAGPDMGAFEADSPVPGDFPRSREGEGELTPPQDVTVRRDVSFLEAGRTERLDLYLPPLLDPGARRPAVLWIHGGGWTGGRKSANRETNVCSVLAAAGYVCASIEYRLGAGAWPQNLLDCKNGVRYLRAHAAELGINPDRIAVAGGSAGAHLALMVGFTAGDNAFEPSARYPGVKSDVRCVIDLYGPANLLTRQMTDETGHPTGQRKAGAAFEVFGATSIDDPIFGQASPVNYVTPSSPPVFIAHGLADTTVDYAQAEELADVLKRQKVPHELMLLENVGHTFDLDSWNDHPLPQDLRGAVLGFLARYL